MAFSSDLFVPSGTYVISNAKFGGSLACYKEQNTRRLTTTADDDFKWKVTLLAQKKWIIQSHSNASAFSCSMPPEPEEGDEIIINRGKHQPHQWVIKRRQAALDTYIIYSPTETGLFWSLQNADRETAPRLVRHSADDSCWWKFRKVEDASETESHPDPLPVTRPTLHPRDGKHINRIAITIPPEWMATISAVSFGQCLNLVRIQRKVEGILESADFVSSWDSVDQPMVINGGDSNSYTIQTVDEVTVVVLDFFHSRNTRRSDPLELPTKQSFSNHIRTSSVSKPSDKRNLPDYQTFWIFDEKSRSDLSSTGTYNAIVTIQLDLKSTIDLNDPGKPEPGSVQDGYNQSLDRPRPGYLDEYLDNYQIIFLIDDSGSMSGGRWKQVRAALAQIGMEAMQYDADGVEMCFINSPLQRDLLKTQAEIFGVYDQVRPEGRTPTGARLQSILGRIIGRLNDAVDTPAYGRMKPIDIIVLTDGAPTDEPAIVIQAAARALDDGLHHPNAVGIQFVQIGNEEDADEQLRALCDGPVRGMVDTVPYVTTFTPDRLKRVLLGALHPSVRAKI